MRQAGDSWRNGIPTPFRSSPKGGYRRLSSTCRGHVAARVTDERPASPRVVIDWKRSPAGNDLKPRITRTMPARWSTRPTVEAPLLHVGRRHPVGRRRPRCRPVTCWPVSARVRQDPRHHRRSAARGRAVRGRVPKDTRSSPKVEAASSSARTTRPSAASRSARRGRRAIRRILIPKGKHIAVQEGDFVQRATS